MPRLKPSRLSPPFLSLGPCVTTNGHVISGAGSPANKSERAIWSNRYHRRAARLLGTPGSKTSWVSSPSRISAMAAFQPLRASHPVVRVGAGTLRSHRYCEVRMVHDHAPGDAFYRAEQVHQDRHIRLSPIPIDDIFEQDRGSPSAITRVWISVISKTVETGVETRTKRPSDSSRSINSLKDA